MNLGHCPSIRLVHCRTYQTSCDLYLFQASHKVVANRGSGQICSAGTPPNIEKVIRAQHGVVLLSISSGGQNSIHGYCYLDNKAQGKDTLYSHIT